MMSEHWDSIAKIVGWMASLLGLVVAVWQIVLWLRRRRQLTWSDAVSAAEDVLIQIEQSAWKPTFVLGLGRSGAIWGGWLAGNLGSLPIAVIDLDYRDSYESTNEFGPIVCDEMGIKLLICKYGKNSSVLVVEGGAALGRTFGNFDKMRRKFGADWDIRYAVLYMGVTCFFHIDYFGVHGPDPWPERFPWHRRDAWIRKMTNRGSRLIRSLSRSESTNTPAF